MPSPRYLIRRLLSAGVCIPLLLSLAACNTGNAPIGLLGKPAPPLHIASHPLQSLRGRVVVLNFWASWCAPCLEEFPALEALQKQMPGITVLAVSFDTSQEAYQRFLRVHNITLRTAFDTTGRSNQAFGTTMPPETWVIDPRGIIRRRFIGARNWTSPEIENFLRAIK